MADDNFFNKPQENMQEDVKTENQEPEGFTFGDKQYSQEDIEKAVGIYEQAQELESKWNTKIDRLMPAYTEATQQKAEYERQLQEMNDKLDQQIAAKAAAGEERSDEEQVRYVRENAEKYGLVTKDSLKTELETMRAEEAQQQMAKSLINQTQEYLESQSADGQPKVEAKDLIAFMDDRGWEYNGKAPIWEDAYNIMARDGIEKWKMSQVSANKPSGLYTQTQSTAGAKQPEEKRVTSENLSGAISDVMSRFQ